MSRIESSAVGNWTTQSPHLPDVLHDLRTIIQTISAPNRSDLYIDTQDVHHEILSPIKARLNRVCNIMKQRCQRRILPAGGTINIRVEEAVCPQWVCDLCFQREDNGISMSKDFQAHVLDFFTK